MLFTWLNHKIHRLMWYSQRGGFLAQSSHWINVYQLFNEYLVQHFYINSYHIKLNLQANTFGKYWAKVKQAFYSRTSQTFKRLRWCRIIMGEWVKGGRYYAVFPKPIWSPNSIFLKISVLRNTFWNTLTRFYSFILDTGQFKSQEVKWLGQALNLLTAKQEFCPTPSTCHLPSHPRPHHSIYLDS